MIIYLLYFFLSPVFWCILQLFRLFNPKINQHLNHQRRSIYSVIHSLSIQQNNREIVIFHAASSGEFEQLKPILREIDRKKYFLIQTFFSPTVFDKEKNSNLFDVSCYHPFDFPWSAFLFFLRFKPNYYILTSHDIWPHHLIFADIFGIKKILINANLHEYSNRLKPFSKTVNRWIFSKFDLILTGSDRLKKRLSELVQLTKIVITGDSRFDQVLQRKSKQTNIFDNTNLNLSKNIILGSIIPSDFDIIFNGIHEAYPKGDESLEDKKHKIIIIPHEIDTKTMSSIIKYLGELGIHFTRFTDLNEKSTENVILVNKVGILADIYAYGDIAYVGAGFGAGVHSVIEPAVHQCAISYGPNIHILDEAISMKEEHIGTIIRSKSDFVDFLKLLDNDLKMKNIQQRSYDFVIQNQGASKNIIDTIFDEK